MKLIDRRILITVLVALAFCALAAFTPKAHAGFDGGGIVLERMREVDNLNAIGTKPFHLPRVCFSACAMYLSVKTVCVEPGTVIGFHGASSDGGKTVDPIGNALALAYYPEKIAKWALDNKALDSEELTIMSAETAWSLGIAKCEAAHEARR